MAPLDKLDESIASLAEALSEIRKELKYHDLDIQSSEHVPSVCLCVRKASPGGLSSVHCCGICREG
jgi:hypothetical protein